MTDRLYAKQEFAVEAAESRQSDVRPTVFDKCRKYTRAREAMAAGVYPYFHRIDSAQEPDVVCDGRPMIMMSSNDYLGLTSHPKVKEAAIDDAEIALIAMGSDIEASILTAINLKTLGMKTIWAKAWS